jgi:alkylation response protein AidB-like acyl-CoA dehydrogenase
MRSLDQARATCEDFLPGMCAALSAIPLLDLEKPGNDGIGLFRRHGGPGLLIAQELGGHEADPLEAMRVIAAVASFSPSLGVATAMHHFSIATLAAVMNQGASDGLEGLLLEEIATKGQLVASAGSEGRSGQSILRPSLTARPVSEGYVVNGSKRPCSLARSMDYFTASLNVVSEADENTFGFLFAPAARPGITVHPFWSSNILAGAESEEIRLTDVVVEPDLVLRPDLTDPSGVDKMSAIGFIWFEFIISATYLGIAYALTSRALDAGRGSVSDRASMGVRLGSATCLVEGIARAIAEGSFDNDALANAVISRFGVLDALTDAARTATQLLGGMAFIESPEIAYLLAAVQPMGFHPPSFASATEHVVAYLGGEPYRFA